MHASPTLQRRRNDPAPGDTRPADGADSGAAHVRASVAEGAAEAMPLEVTVVMPCLNEADTLATCIRKALTAMKNAGIDDSRAIAIAEGARLVPVADRGYGAALMGGIEAARGRFVIMGDADDSYDFGEVPAFVERLREGDDLVQGCRLESGGGRVLPGAMPRLHRWLGNPM